MATIKVPKTPKKSFNTHRRPSALLISQIEHLEWAARPAAQRTPGLLPSPRVRTEGEAAERIAELTRKILNAHSQPPTVSPPSPDAVATADRGVPPHQGRVTPKRRRAARPATRKKRPAQRRRRSSKKGRSAAAGAQKRRRGR